MLTAFPATITVSGYPPLPATQLRLNNQCVGTISAGVDPTRCAPGLPPTMRCSCGQIARPDLRLGFGGYCAMCVGHLLVECLQHCHRVPDAGEFYCVGCHDILPRDAMQHRDPDGRRRLRCRGCRREQLRGAKRRFQARHGSPLLTGSSIAGAAWLLTQSSGWMAVRSGSARMLDGWVRAVAGDGQSFAVAVR